MTSIQNQQIVIKSEKIVDTKNYKFNLHGDACIIFQIIINVLKHEIKKKGTLSH